MIEKGYKPSIAKRIAAPQAASTLAVYESKWNVYERWCEEKRKDPHDPNVPQVAEFLTHLFNLGRAPRTIEGYRTAIAGALKIVTDTDLGQNVLLSNLIQSFFRERPPSRETFPDWDLSFVLFSLAGDTFEPMETIDFSLLTLKTVFLTLLASGARRGEIHALAYDSKGIDKEWKKITLRPIEGFVSKTELRSKGGTALKEIVIPALRGVGNDLPLDKKLCPVRALKYYLSRTKGMRQDKKLFFIPIKKGKQGDIKKNTISSWVKRLLQIIYQNPDAHAARLTGRTTHRIRELASSYALRGQCDLERIMKACSWKANTTFTDFYLRDLTEIRDDMIKLGPVVVAQQIVQPQDVA